ncbi:MAG: PAAR domain-containing protein [Polyangiaceae bacterium]|nr:PAAR domain-containing protein [Polyangiaceae bacterium]
MSASYLEASYLAFKGNVMSVVTPLLNVAGVDPDRDPKSPAKPMSTARAISSVIGAVTAITQIPAQLGDTGFALLTAGISNMLPLFPAATATTMYMALPHCHSHPPSLIPPAPPIPLPSIGLITSGSMKVLINGKWAARAGDIGLAPTCCSFTPFFEIKTGSSKVFIGGQRAARAIDFAWACRPGDKMDKKGLAMLAIGMVAGVAGIVADKQDASESAAQGNAAMAAAQSLAAEMAAKQMAADAAMTVVKQLLGKDKSVPPLPSTPGMITNIGSSATVSIGGFPIIPDPVGALTKFLKKMLAARKGKRENSEKGEEGCPNCPHGPSPS